MDFNALAGQCLLGVDVFEPWGEYTSQRYSPKGVPPLSGALVFLFDRAALICTSPLRYLRHQQGTLYGLPSGATVSLGYRATVCEREDVAALLPITFGLPSGEEYWHSWRESALPAIGTTLTEAVIVGERGADGEPAWGIELRIAQGRRYRLSYRPELDGSLELAAPGQHFSLDQIVVEGPEQDFGWLHPAVLLDFILDDQVWRTAKVADWPLALRKALQSHHAPEDFYRQTTRRALLARFRQRPFHLQRLLALRNPVHCSDVPDGLIEEVAAELRFATAEPVDRSRPPVR